MEENKLSTNLEKINVSVNDMRSTLNIEGASIDELTDKVVETKTSLDELENNMVYQVKTREEMNTLIGVAEGSTCLVKGTEIRPSREGDSFTVVHFPETVVLPTSYTGSSFELYIADTGHGSLLGTLTGPYFDFPMIIKGQGSYAKNIKYTATQSGSNYIFTRTDTYGTPVTSAGALSYKIDTYAYNECVGQFFQIEADLEEQYIYRNGDWEYINPEEIEELNMIIEEKEQIISDLDTEIEDLNNTIIEQNEEIEQLKQNQGTGESGNGLYQVANLEELNALLGGA